MKKRFVVFNFFLILSSVLFSASASAEKRLSFSFDQANGPINGTKVVRMVDKDKGAVCYFYVPEKPKYSVPSQHINPYAGSYYGQIGSVSCIPIRKK